PVDFARRMELLAQPNDDWPALARNWTDGRIKLAWTAELLRLRQTAAAVFSSGDYRPLAVTGAHAAHVVAYARVYKHKAAIAIALRNFAALTDGGRQWPKFDAIEAQIHLRDSELRVKGVSGDIVEAAAVLHQVPAIVLLGDVAPSRVSVASTKRH